MASPAMLRGVFGRSFKGWHIPDEVLQEIFRFGFHLWMARPLDVVVEVEVMFTHYAFSTRRAVTDNQLSEQARRLVDFERYWEDIFKMPHVEVLPRALARPAVWDGLVWWAPPYRGCEEQWVLPGLPPEYQWI